MKTYDPFNWYWIVAGSPETGWDWAFFGDQ